MKMNITKEWAESRLPGEEGQEIGAGCPAAICSPRVDVLLDGVLDLQKTRPIPSMMCDPSVCGHDRTDDMHGICKSETSVTNVMAIVEGTLWALNGRRIKLTIEVYPENT